MSITELRVADHRVAPATVDVEIVIPVHNEEAQLERSIARLQSHLATSFPFTSAITIADNASTDGTWPIATRLAADQPGLHAIRLGEKGRGRALRAAWARSTASVVAYMDVDLATGLDALVPLVAPLLSGHSDLAVGTRLARGAHVVRGARRELISRAYNLLLRAALRSTCTDAQCGFKAVRRTVALELVSLVEDEGWFFDTEMLVTAQRRGLRVLEVPVHWVDDTDSRVDVVRTALVDLRGVWRLLGGRPAVRPGPPPPRGVRSVAAAGGQASADELWRFAGVGVASTLVYVGLFASARSVVGSYAANALAVALCSLGNTALHRGLAGRARSGLDRRGRWAAATALLAVSLGFTSLALAGVGAAGLDTPVPELAAVAVASLAASFVRFAILRTWVFRPTFGTNLAVPAEPRGTADDGLRRLETTTKETCT